MIPPRSPLPICAPLLRCLVGGPEDPSARGRRNDGVNAFLLWRAQRAKLDRFRLQDLAAELQLDDALADLLAFTSRFRRREPTPEELEHWSRRSP